MMLAVPTIELKIKHEHRNKNTYILLLFYPTFLDHVQQQGVR